MPRPLLLSVTVLWLSACAPTSRIDSQIPLAELQPGEVAQLCRFTVDVSEGADPGCVSYTLDYDTCRGAPPWVACPAGARAADVGSWEDCVRASQTCEADSEVCWHVACL